MSKSIGVTGLVLVLLIAGILVVPALWAGRMPTSSTFFSSILPTPTLPGGGTPRPPTVLPPTVVFPTPATPIPNAPLITSEQAISIAMEQNPIWAQLQQRGELTVTTKLTVHSDKAAYASGTLIFHPQLRVWMVYFHTPPQPHFGGPAGTSIPMRYANLFAYEIDAVTGHVLAQVTTYVPNEATSTVTPEAVP